MANLVVKPQVEFMEAVKLAFKNGIQFSGRARRSEFWWAQLAFVIISLLVCWIPIIGQLISVCILVVNLALTFRRLHDTNHSGWWVGVPLLVNAIALVILIATTGLAVLTGDMDAIAGAGLGSLVLIGLLYCAAGLMQIVVIVFCCIDSDQTANKFGESNKYVLEEENAILEPTV